MNILKIIFLLTFIHIYYINGYCQQYPKEYYSDSYIAWPIKDLDSPILTCQNKLGNNTTYVRVTEIHKLCFKDYIVVELSAYKIGGRDRLGVYPSPNTYISYCNGVKKSKLLFIGTKLLTPEEAFTLGYGSDAKDYEVYPTYLFFEGIPPCDKISIIDPGSYINGTHCQMPTFNDLVFITNEEWQSNGFEAPEKFLPKKQWTEETIKQFAKSHNDGICGIYEGITSNNYKLGCIKEDGEYKFIYLGCSVYNCWWNIGDIKAVLRSTATTGLFKADWAMLKKEISRDVYITFNGTTMEVLINDNVSPIKDSYLKMYPSIGNNITNNASNNNYYEPPFTAKWSGSGFALNRGYIATNHHVIDGARNIKVYGVKGNFNIGYNAQVVLSDPHNDLAVIKINDSRFTSFGTIPYRVKTNMAEVGEEVFVLGYPMTTTMGDEIKLTTGVISARSGFQGDLSLYQTTAPIQPGNSGGPLFDNSGNLIGIVNAKHIGAENVGYAIKASYLSNLIQSGSMSGLLPQTNSISGQNLSGKVKSVKNFVFLIKCN